MCATDNDTQLRVLVAGRDRRATLYNADDRDERERLRGLPFGY